jgi:hypothetical protein
MTAPQISKLTLAAFGAMSSYQINTLPPEAFAVLTGSHLANLPLERFGDMTALQTQMLNQAALATLTSSQLARLSPGAFAGLMASQISSFSEVQCKGITAAQIGRLSTAQISALKSFDWLSADAFAGLTAGQIKSVSTAGQVGNSWRFMTAAQISKLTPAAFGAMSSDQLQSVFATFMGTITAAQLSSLSQDQCKGITATQIGALSADQISGLQYFDCLSADAFAALTRETIRSVSTTGQRGWQYMTAAQVGKLAPDVFAAMSAFQLGSISKDGCKGITTSQIFALSAPGVDCFTFSSWCAMNEGRQENMANSIKIENFGRLSLETLAKISSAKAGYTSVHAGDFSYLDGTQVNRLSNTQLAQMSDAQVQNLRAAGFGTVYRFSSTSMNENVLNTLDKDGHTVLGALSDQQLQLVADYSDGAASLIQAAANDMLWIHGHAPAIVTNTFTINTAIATYKSLAG